MTDKKCPFCGCLNFYIKDPEDEYEIFEFELRDGEIVFNSEVDVSQAPEPEDETKVYCNQCAWNGHISQLNLEGKE